MDEFTRGQKAYEILIDPRRRQRYDETGAEGINDPEATEKAEVLDTVSQTLTELLSSDIDIESNDIAALASQTVRRGIDEGLKHKATLECALTRIQTAAKRFRLKLGDRPDVIADVLKGREIALLRQIEHCDHILQVKSKAFDVFDGYLYDVDARPSVGGLDYDALVALVKRTAPPST